MAELAESAAATLRRRDESEAKREAFREVIRTRGGLHPLQRMAWSGLEADASEELWKGSAEEIANAEKTRRVLAVVRLQLAALGGADDDGGDDDDEDEERPDQGDRAPPEDGDATAAAAAEAGGRDDGGEGTDRLSQLAEVRRSQEQTAVASAEAAACRARRADIRPDIQALRARVAQQAHNSDANVHVHRRRLVRVLSLSFSARLGPAPSRSVALVPLLLLHFRGRS